MFVSGLLGLWWLIDFVGNDDRSFVNVYLVMIAQFTISLLTIMVVASQRR
jgi:undecaprenyl pyrophosphate phosphatase UppP